jgi:RNA-directed DNA polymerase
MIMKVNAKSQPISKRRVWNAYLAMRNNGKSAGVDAVSLDEFKEEEAKHLYKLWNRMASGSYYPLPVREVEIPKKDGGIRRLGIPTVADRVAQMVVKIHLEPKLEEHFHKDSYGYRPGKDAHQALETARDRCESHPWVIDLDIKGFFDTIDHELLMKAVRKHCQEKWVLLYIERWLKAPLFRKDGTIQQRDKGTPQGGVISPLLANLFLHYSFDKWMERNHPAIGFERYADDIIVHCKSRKEADNLLKGIKARLKACRLELHPQKTKLVYCKQSSRKRDYDCISFTFLGYAFQPRLVRYKDGRREVRFTPAICNEAKKKINADIRNMRIQRRTNDSIYDIAKLLNAKLHGWINYFGRFRKYEMKSIMYGLNSRLLKWVSNRYKQHRTSKRRALKKLRMFYNHNPGLFAHWQHGFVP